MKPEHINTLNDLNQLAMVLNHHLGYIPKNLIIVSKDVMNEVKAYNNIQSEQSLSNIEILNIKVMNDIAEITD